MDLVIAHGPIKPIAPLWRFCLSSLSLNVFGLRPSLRSQHDLVPFREVKPAYALAVTPTPLSLRCAGRRGLTVIVRSPAYGGAIGPHTASVVEPSANGDEFVTGRRGLSKMIAAPALDRTVGPQTASMVFTNADGGELSSRGLRGTYGASPTGDGSVGPHSAAGIPCANGGELAHGRCGPVAETFSSPAVQGAIGPHPAGMVVPSANRNELTGGRRGLSIVVIAPADDRAVDPHSASVTMPSADGGELAIRGLRVIIIASPTHDGAICASLRRYVAVRCRRRRTRRQAAWPCRRWLITPAADGAVGPYPAGVLLPGADGREFCYHLSPGCAPG